MSEDLALYAPRDNIARAHAITIFALDSVIRSAMRWTGTSPDVAKASVKQKNVALVENDSLMLQAIERLLVAHGFGVQSYGSAEDFLARGMTGEAACLVLDIHLGGMSGVVLRRKLLESGSKLPVIFMTAFDNESTHKEAVGLGCSAYLLKPFSASALVGAIEAATS